MNDAIYSHFIVYAPEPTQRHEILEKKLHKFDQTTERKKKKSCRWRIIFFRTQISHLKYSIRTFTFERHLNIVCGRF